MREINHLSLHQWLRSAIPDSQQPTSPIGFLFLKLPPPPCAVLLVYGKLKAKVVCCLQVPMHSHTSLPSDFFEKKCQDCTRHRRSCPRKLFAHLVTSVWKKWNELTTGLVRVWKRKHQKRCVFDSARMRVFPVA